MYLHEYMKARLTFINMYSNRLHSVEKKLEAPYVFWRNYVLSLIAKPLFVREKNFLLKFKPWSLKT